jgi:hypothetical protein
LLEETVARSPAYELRQCHGRKTHAWYNGRMSRNEIMVLCSIERSFSKSDQMLSWWILVNSFTSCKLH